jgi:hypothetical protein
LGRVLSGIATSILYSSFESWMIKQHQVVRKYGLNDSKIDCSCTFLLKNSAKSLQFRQLEMV